MKKALSIATFIMAAAAFAFVAYQAGSLIVERVTKILKERKEAEIDGEEIQAEDGVFRVE